MNFQVGDVLLKVDMRAYKPASNFYDTRDHVMLVIGKNQSNGFPIIAHMTFHNDNNQPGLKVETLTRGKDLFLLAYPFSDEIRKKIVELAQLAYQSKKFTINAPLLAKQYQESSEIRDKPKRFKPSFNLVCPIAFNPNPVEFTELSCHEFVVSVIQSACADCNKAIPKSLRIKPGLAWSDILLKAAREIDKEVVVDCFSFDSQVVAHQDKRVGLFANLKKVNCSMSNSNDNRTCMLQ